MIRLIASDIDETLLNPEGKLTPRTLSAVQSIIEAGALFSLSSGRMPEAMIAIAQAVGVNAPLISYNGALIYDMQTKKALYQHAIPLETACEVLKALEGYGIYAQGYSKDGVFCREKCEYTYQYEKSLHIVAHETHQRMSEWVHEDMIKLLAIDTPEKLDKLIPELQKRFKDVQFMKSRAHYLEMVAQGVDKGVAILRLGEIFGIQKDEIMAFGDGQNDLSMIAAAGTGCAMGNAVESLKQAADIIAPKNTEDGVAQILEQYLQSGKIGGKAHG